MAKKPFSTFLPDEALAELAKQAARVGKTPSELAREILLAGLYPTVPTGAVTDRIEAVEEAVKSLQPILSRLQKSTEAQGEILQKIDSDLADFSPDELMILARSALRLSAFSGFGLIDALLAGAGESQEKKEAARKVVESANAKADNRLAEVLAQVKK